MASSTTATAAITSAPSSGQSPRGGQPVRAHRPDRPVVRDLDQRPRRRDLDETDREQCQRRPEPDQQEHEQPGALALGRDADGARRL